MSLFIAAYSLGEIMEEWLDLLKYSLININVVALPKIEDSRGNLSVIENYIIPFEIKKVNYLYDVPTGAERGGHAHKELQQFLIAVSGSFDLILNDGREEQKVTLNKPFEGLLINNGIWREFKNFSSGSV